MTLKKFTFRGRKKGGTAPLTTPPEAAPRSAAGFTLIELMVSVGIFVIVLAMVSTSYISIIRGQRQANEVRKMYSDVRVLMDTLGEEVRLGAIDYECYNPPAVPGLTIPCPYSVGGKVQQGRTDHLALVSGNEKTLIFLGGDGFLKMQKYVKEPGGWSPAAGYSTAQTLLSDRLQVKHIGFAIFPEVNPYSDDSKIYADNTTQFQPKVTVFLSVENVEGSSAPFEYDFQTSFSSRTYSRSL